MSERPARWKIVAAGTAVVAIGVGAFFAYASTQHSGSPIAQVRSWVNGTNLGQSVGTVLGDAHRVEQAVVNHKGTGILHTDCGVLISDAQSANGNLPTPDTELTNLLSSGYALAYDAGTDCYDSGGTDRARLDKSIRERIQAEAKLGQAVNLVNQLLGITLSTTTTTQPGEGILS